MLVRILVVYVVCYLAAGAEIGRQDIRKLLPGKETGSRDCNGEHSLEGDEHKCSTKRKPNTNGCPNNFLLVEQSCYLISSDPLTFEAANFHCRSMDSNLTMIHTAMRFQTITYLLADTVHLPVWLGGTDILKEGYWLWQDSSPVPLGTPYWALAYNNTLGYIQEPIYNTDLNCMTLRNEVFHHYSPVACGSLALALCETSLEQVNSSTETTEFSPGTSDSTEKNFWNPL